MGLQHVDTKSEHAWSQYLVKAFKFYSYECLRFFSFYIQNSSGPVYTMKHVHQCSLPHYAFFISPISHLPLPATTSPLYLRLGHMLLQALLASSSHSALPSFLSYSFFFFMLNLSRPPHICIFLPLSMCLMARFILCHECASFYVTVIFFLHLFLYLSLSPPPSSCISPPLYACAP